MENKIIHFVFNEDRYEEDTFSKRILRKPLSCWLVQDFPVFTFYLDSLPADHLITIWIHLQAIGNPPYKGEDIANEFIRKFGEDFKFGYITRTDKVGSHSDGIEIVHINKLDDKVKDPKYHHLVKDVLVNHNKDKDLVLISHSTDDKVICDKLENLLVNGYSIPQEKIVYTSGSGTGIPTGASIPGELQRKLTKVGLFIAVLTENYLKSPIAFAELNAIKLFEDFDNKHIIILKSDDVKYKESGMFNEHDVILSLSNKCHYYKIYDDCREFFNRNHIKLEKLQEEIEKYFK